MHLSKQPLTQLIYLLICIKKIEKRYWWCDQKFYQLALRHFHFFHILLIICKIDFTQWCNEYDIQLTGHMTVGQLIKDMVISTSVHGPGHQARVKPAHIGLDKDFVLGLCWN